jgi:hypothetical protein
MRYGCPTSFNDRMLVSSPSEMRQQFTRTGAFEATSQPGTKPATLAKLAGSVMTL